MARKKKIAVREIVLGGLGGIVIGFVVGVLTPIGSYWGEKLKLMWTTPDVRLSVMSVLLSRRQGESVADLKIRFRITSSDPQKRYVQPLFLKNSATGDSVSLSAAPPFGVDAIGIELDSIYLSSQGLNNAFEKLPTGENSGWQLDYRIAGDDDVQTSQTDVAGPEKLHFFLMPSGVWNSGDTSSLRPVIIAHTKGVYVLDSTGLSYVGKDTTAILVYPPDKVGLSFDFDEDGRADSQITASDFTMRDTSGTAGYVCGVHPDLTYFFQRYSGFVFAMKGNRVAPDSIGFTWFNSEQRADLSRVFGGTIDADVPLLGREFIYYEFR